MRRLALLSLLLLSCTASPVTATMVYEFHAVNIGLSFSWTQGVFKEDFWAFNDPYDGNPDGPLLTLIEPPDCDVFQIVVDGDGFTSAFPGGNEIEVFGKNATPLAALYVFGFGSQRFDHFGTYQRWYPVLTISEVPHNGPIWLLGAIAPVSIVGSGLALQRPSAE